MESQRLRILQLQQDAAALDAVKQQQAQATPFAIRAQNMALMILDTLQLAGEVRQAFCTDATPTLVALFNVKGLAESNEIVEVLLPLAHTYRERRDGFTAPLLSVLSARGDSLKLDEQSRLRFYADGAKAAQPLYAHSLLATSGELATVVQPVAVQYGDSAARNTTRLKPHSVFGRALLRAF